MVRLIQRIKMEVVTFMLCFIILVVNCESAVLSPDIEPPKFTFCPSDKVVETFEYQVRVIWKEPIAVDNSGRVPIVMGNFLNGMQVMAGRTFNVEYIAKDDSDNIATCKFKITVKRKVVPCPKLSRPANGALLCNVGPDFPDRFCVATCQSGYDFAFWPNLIYLCSQQGVWSGIGVASQRVPDCSVRRGPTLSQGYYYKGDANDGAVQLALKNNFQTMIKSIGFGILCQDSDKCNSKNVVIYPGSTGK
ncbi:sushi repeat-containing protein SRPX-like [Actinia tenebrosa]|uniref:Sushi repeat-containing protein SRPX-like n=1 Tax=Actinia tenebrosa TaxID=6105 RepID=A0A6P8HGQ6_ACTTE|nr:sushi repeat-containing protein SRPX-like [Actinia tenebrosa]